MAKDFDISADIHTAFWYINFRTLALNQCGDKELLPRGFGQNGVSCVAT